MARIVSSSSDSALARMRVERGLSLARLAGMVYYNPNDVHKWENKKRKPSPETMAALAKALDCTVEELDDWD